MIEVGGIMSDYIILDCKKILRMLIKKSWLFIIVLVVFSCGGYVKVQNKSGNTINYVANGKIFVTQEYTDETGQFSDNSSRLQPVYDTTEVLTSNGFLSIVKANLSSQISIAELKSNVVVQHLTPTRVLNIQITRKSEEEAKEYLKIILNSSKEYLEMVMPGVNVEILETSEEIAVTPIKIDVNGLKTGMLIGIIMCLCIVIVLVLLYILNNAIRYEEDVDEYLKIQLLGTISEVK